MAANCTGNEISCLGLLQWIFLIHGIYEDICIEKCHAITS